MEFEPIPKGVRIAPIFYTSMAVIRLPIFYTSLPIFYTSVGHFADFLYLKALNILI